MNVIDALAPMNVNLTIAFKQLQFSWDTTGADHYRILENPDGVSGFTVVPGTASIAGTSYTLEIPVHKTDWANAQYIIEACNADDSETGVRTQISLILTRFLF